jgi:hypothetical protein
MRLFFLRLSGSRFFQCLTKQVRGIPWESGNVALPIRERGEGICHLEEYIPRCPRSINPPPVKETSLPHSVPPSPAAMAGRRCKYRPVHVGGHLTSVALTDFLLLHFMTFISSHFFKLLRASSLNKILLKKGPRIARRTGIDRGKFSLKGPCNMGARTLWNGSA